MEKIIYIAAKVSTPLGLAGITIATLFLLSREILRANIFPTLTKNLSGDIIKLLIQRLFVLALLSLFLGFAGFAITIFNGRESTKNSQSEGDKESVYSGQVTDITGKAVYGALVEIRDDQGNIQTTKTDSVGRFQYNMKVAIRSAHFRVSTEKYETYEREVPPGQPAHEPFALTPKPVLSPTPTPTPRPRPYKTPCSAEDRLVGKC